MIRFRTGRLFRKQSQQVMGIEEGTCWDEHWVLYGKQFDNKFHIKKSFSVTLLIIFDQFISCRYFLDVFLRGILPFRHFG